MYAAKLLSPVGCHILHPGYNILMNMSSLTSFSFLTQAFRRQTRRSWMSRSADTGRWLYPRRVPGRTNLSVTPTFGSVGIVDTRRYQPASTIVLARYAANLARTMKPTSISAYMNVVRIIHLEHGHSNPLDNWYLSTVLRGIKNNNSKPPRQMLPITPVILRKMYGLIDLTINLMKSFWAAALIAFFTFFRKSTLLPMSRVHKCNIELCRSDFKIRSDCAVINVKQTKTLRGRDRKLVIPVPVMPGNILCPVKAVSNHLASGPCIPAQAALFSYNVSDGVYKNLCNETFIAIIRDILSRC